MSWLGRQSPTLGSRAAETLFLSPGHHRRPDWEAQLLARAERFEVAHAGRHLPAWSWGEGPTVLLLHGWEGRGSQLGHFVEPLVRAGHRVVTFDFPGHGDAPRAQVSVIDFARVLAAIHRALGKVEAVIAHSVGGAAAALAQTLSPFAARLVLIGAPRGPRRFFDGFVRALSLDGATARATEARLFARYGLALDDIDASQFAPHVAARTLVIHDRGDREVPFSHAEALVASLPNARLLATDGLGHRRILKEPAVIRAACEFARAPSARPLAAQLDAELFDHERVA